jgi:hypothetical protein
MTMLLISHSNTKFLPRAPAASRAVAPNPLRNDKTPATDSADHESLHAYDGFQFVRRCAKCHTGAQSLHE